MSQPNIPYILSERLGSGTYANVFKAFKKTGPREVVAIKCVKRARLNKLSVDNLVKEIELLKTLRHENIVGLVDFFWDAEHIYIVLEYCAGGDLFQFIRQQRRLPENIVRHFLRQLASALHYLRHHNVVHMDLKPQNLLLTNSYNPTLKVADFGFAHHFELTNKVTGEESVALDQVRGSLLYMAPEMVTKKQYGPKCDLWSTGVIMFECLFGKAPFASENLEELGEKIRSEAPVTVPQSSDISAECHDLLCRLLQRDPAKRLDYPEFFAHPFVDLDHMPSAQSFGKGNVLVQEAVAADLAGKLRDAVSLYTEALRHLVPALQYETNATRKEAIRTKVSEYMARAEALSERLATNGGTRRQRTISEEKHGLQELALRCEGDSQLAASVADLQTFYSMIDGKRYKDALTHFENAAPKVLQTVKNDSNLERKRAFQGELSRAMSAAEDLKALPQSTAISRMEVDADMLKKSKKENCVVM